MDVLTTNNQQYLWQAMLSVPLGVRAGVNDPTRIIPSQDLFRLNVPVVDLFEVQICPLYWFLLNTVPHRSEAFPPAAVLDIVFGSQESGGIAAQPPYFLAPAVMDPQGIPITPGFAFTALELCR